MAKSGQRAVFGVLFLVFVFFVLLMVFASYTLNTFQSESNLIGESGKNGSIGVVKVEGTIMDAEPTLKLLHRAEKDKKIKAIILRIDSPGGAVGPTQEIYEEVRRIDSAYDEDPSKGKPVYASFGSIAASGGYYLGAATRKIYTNAGTLTGSIGVIMQFMDLSKLYELAKVNAQVIKSGEFKDFGNPHRGLTEQERHLLEVTSNDVHKQFKEDVLLLRKDRLKKPIDELAQGQVFSGREALELGLVDELGGLWKAGRKIHEELKLEGEFGLKFVKEKEKTSLLELARSLEEVKTTISLVRQWVSARTNESPSAMFLMR
ncbi:MAG: signal peptide peptidase SppA [Halobacteriovorax sp.]|nr:signal peptide peptidase SppA [Halobacteriovorax sp.]